MYENASELDLSVCEAERRHEAAHRTQRHSRATISYRSNIGQPASDGLWSNDSPVSVCNQTNHAIQLVLDRRLLACVPLSFIEHDIQVPALLILARSLSHTFSAMP
jgi:hypothetical protein